jgi:hypothetical protein
VPSQISPDIPGREASAGGEADGLSLRLVLRALRRCLPMLRPVRADLLRFALAVAVLGVIGTAAGALLLDLHWTRVLQGEPLTAFEARLLGFDPATSVHVEALDAATRRRLRDHELALGAACAARAARQRPRLLPARSSSASTRAPARLFQRLQRSLRSTRTAGRRRHLPALSDSAMVRT